MNSGFQVQNQSIRTDPSELEAPFRLAKRRYMPDPDCPAPEHGHFASDVLSLPNDLSIFRVPVRLPSVDD
jgi:hypothetical protein